MSGDVIELTPGQPVKVVSEHVVHSRGADGKPVVYTAVRVEPATPDDVQAWLTS